jgi:hypothetical protein
MENLMEILIPIIFFIIWTLSSISASKKKQQQPAPPSKEEPYHPQESHPASSANPVEDLKRTLENIFSEMAEEKLETVESQPSEEKPKPQKPIQSSPEQVSKAVTREKTPSQKKSIYTFSPHEETASVFSSQELRKAIVLMEILSPPVSMRE